MPCFRFKGKEEDIMSEYFNVADIFGEDVFSDKVMQERLPKKVYKALRRLKRARNSILQRLILSQQL